MGQTFVDSLGVPTQPATQPEGFLAILGVLLFFGLLLPRLLKPLHLPFATSLILVGSILGPHGIGLFVLDDGLALFGFLGATFHMLLAGTEARALGIRPRERATARVLALNGVLPAIAGSAIARGFGYGWTASLFVGIIFLSSSIMLVFGIVGALRLERTTAGRLMKRVSVVEDLTASVLAFVLFRTVVADPRFPLPILGGLLVSSVLILRMLLPEVVAFFFARLEGKGGDHHEARLRFVIAVMLLVIFGYSVLDVHPVIAAFLVGFTLAEVPGAASLRQQLQTLGYGIFIPVFLFVVGLDTDLTLLTRFDAANGLAVAILGGAVGTKLVTGFAGARWAGLEPREAAFISVASTVKLTVPLSATYVARDLGILDAELFSAIVIMSVATSMLAPLLLPLIAGRSLTTSEASA